MPFIFQFKQRRLKATHLLSGSDSSGEVIDHNVLGVCEIKPTKRIVRSLVKQNGIFRMKGITIPLGPLGNIVLFLSFFLISRNHFI